MPYCPKCGTEVREEMTFCPKCGAPLKAPPAGYRPEKYEKREKEEKEEREKREKTEKYEKREFGVVGPIIGGLILIFLGLIFYFQIIGFARIEILGALFFFILGIIIIIGAVYAMKRHPRP
ncbi:MAG: zinc ribbon domain-containing protein [Candidatus Methylarchaceae archaeon HK02M1]|nr:zinc ribbon domain-containing protein [Candidatus Methylarchaceae archaeon HK01M]MCP8311664.1 zinc ribbon domain-containing protein [Candidatus Methylarchaceae archaeon HK02M1]